jgi:hypothetical protein
MLVLHPSTSTEREGPLGNVVAPLTGVPEGMVKVSAEVAVMNEIGVELAT